MVVHVHAYICHLYTAGLASLCVCVCVCVCICVCVYILCVYICVRACVYMHMCMCTGITGYLGELAMYN